MKYINFIYISTLKRSCCFVSQSFLLDMHHIWHGFRSALRTTNFVEKCTTRNVLVNDHFHLCGIHIKAHSQFFLFNRESWYCYINHKYKYVKEVSIHSLIPSHITAKQASHHGVLFSVKQHKLALHLCTMAFKWLHMIKSTETFNREFTTNLKHEIKCASTTNHSCIYI